MAFVYFFFFCEEFETPRGVLSGLLEEGVSTTAGMDSITTKDEQRHPLFAE